MFIVPSKNPRLAFLSLTAYLTLAGVMVGGVLAIPLILERWLVMGILIGFGFLITRYPDLENNQRQRNAFWIMVLQTVLVVILLQYQEASIIFAILFFILSVTAGLYFPFRFSLLWIVLFISIVALSMSRFSAWEDALGFTGAYTGGYLFLGIVANTLSRLEISQRANERLLAELQAKNEQLEEYASQVENLTVVEERNRLAREMHDTIGHRLTVSAVQLEGAQRLVNSNPERSEVMIGNVREQVRLALQELRQTVSRLREPVELELSLPQALRRLTASFQEATQIAIQMDLPDEPCEINSAQHLVLYRAAQEALTNIQRHASAQHVDIRLVCSEQHIEFIVRDDGRGLSVTSENKGFGLMGLRERAAQLGGELTCQSLPDKGTEFMLRLPIRNLGGA